MYLFIYFKSILNVNTTITYLIQGGPGTPGDDIPEGLCGDIASFVV